MNLPNDFFLFSEEYYMNCGLTVSCAKYILFQIAHFTKLYPFLQQFFHIFIYKIKTCGVTYLIGNMGNIDFYI